MKNLKSYGHATDGILHTFKHENNFKYQLVAALLIIAICIYIRLDIRSWITIITLIGLVLMAELFNTAIEKLADIIHPEYHFEIGKVKDISAAAVLIISITALIIGIVIISSSIV